MNVGDSSTRLRIVIVGGNLVVSMGLRRLLESTGQAAVVGEAANGRSAVRTVRELRPDVVLLNIRTPGLDGLTVVPELAEVARVLVLTLSTEDDIVWTALRKGASGVLVHGSFTPEELVRAVEDKSGSGRHLSPQAAAAVVRTAFDASTPEWREPHDDEFELSRREREIMEHISRGLSNADISRLLFVTEKTVKNHVNHIYAKLHVRNRAEAIAVWLGLADRTPA